MYAYCCYILWCVRIAYIRTDKSHLNGSQSETSQILRISPNIYMFQVKAFWWCQQKLVVLCRFARHGSIGRMMSHQILAPTLQKLESASHMRLRMSSEALLFLWPGQSCGCGLHPIGFWKSKLSQSFWFNGSHLSHSNGCCSNASILATCFYLGQATENRTIFDGFPAPNMFSATSRWGTKGFLHFERFLCRLAAWRRWNRILPIPESEVVDGCV